jgi:hypothetical protein
MNENAKPSGFRLRRRSSCDCGRKLSRATTAPAKSLVTVARTHNTGDNATSKDQYDWSQLTDEELNQLERILVKASVVA